MSLQASLTSSPSAGVERHPRIEVVPEFTESYGELAIELSRRAGQVLDFWQGRAVVFQLAVRPDGKWLCFEYVEIVARQNGKGGILEARVLFGFLVLGERLIMWSAHEYKTAMEAFRRMRTLITNLGERVADNLISVDGVIVKVNNTNGEESFERLDTGARIKFIARSKGSGRGFSGDLNIIDETFAYTPDQHAALMPTMNARPNPQIIYTSSPPLTPDSGEVLYNLRERALAGGDDSLGYRDWGVAGELDHLERIDLDDETLWEAANPALNIRISGETIRRNRRSMGALEFAREILGVWWRRRQGGGAIDMATWASMADALSRRDGDVALGVDIAPTRDFAAIALYGVRVDGLGHGQLVDYRAGTEWIVPRLVELRESLAPVAVGMGAGTYKSLKPELETAGFRPPEELDKPQRGDVAIAAGSDMSAACGQMIDATRQTSFRHVGQPQLDAAVSGAQTKVTGDTIAWSRKDADTDICPLVSLTVARWAFLTRILAPPPPPATAKVPDTPADLSDLWRPRERLSI